MEFSLKYGIKFQIWNVRIQCHQYNLHLKFRHMYSQTENSQPTVIRSRANDILMTVCLGAQAFLCIVYGLLRTEQPFQINYFMQMY